MRKLALIMAALLLVAGCGTARKAKEIPDQDSHSGQRAGIPDSTVFARLDSLMDSYCEAMMAESLETKCGEVDFLIGSASDSLVRQHIALHLYEHYVDAPLMGEEAVAIHIYDKWFEPGIVKMRGEFDLMAAEVFAKFNRSTLLGMQAPVTELADPEGIKHRIPSEGRLSVLYFHRPDCSKCRLFTAALPGVLDASKPELDFTAVYCGSDAGEWAQFRSNFVIQNPKVHLIHLWDPEFESNYQVLYGVISTPRLYLISEDGTVLGRRLEPENLAEMLDIIAIFAPDGTQE